MLFWKALLIIYPERLEPSFFILSYLFLSGKYKSLFFSKRKPQQETGLSSTGTHTLKDRGKKSERKAERTVKRNQKL